MSSKVYVAIYGIIALPADQQHQLPDPHHWALWVSSPNGEDIILQIEDDKGGRGYFVAPPLRGKQPQQSSRCEEIIPCGTIPEDCYNDAVVLIESTPVDNESETWNCQAWIMEALTMLAQINKFVWEKGAEAELLGKREYRQ